MIEHRGIEMLLEPAPTLNRDLFIDAYQLTAADASKAAVAGVLMAWSGLGLAGFQMAVAIVRWTQGHALSAVISIFVNLTIGAALVSAAVLTGRPVQLWRSHTYRIMIIILTVFIAFTNVFSAVQQITSLVNADKEGASDDAPPPPPGVSAESAPAEGVQLPFGKPAYVFARPETLSGVPARLYVAFSLLAAISAIAYASAVFSVVKIHRPYVTPSLSRRNTEHTYTHPPAFEE